jgi:micrococcal nuclease
MQRKSAGGTAARMTGCLLLLSLVSGPATAKPAAEGQCRHEPKAFRCVKYLKNYDGDTITFDIPDVHPLIGKTISVRVRGVDTPEVKTSDPCEKESARMAKNLVESFLKRARRVDLENVDRDKYFRILADVKADGEDMKSVLMRNGLAYAYDGGKKKKVDWCAVARGDSRKNRHPAGGR